VASFTPHHFLHNLQMGPISWCVCPLQTFPPSVMKQAIFYSFVPPGSRAPQSASPRRLSRMTRASTRRPPTKWPWNCSQALLRSGLGKFKISLCLFICPSVNLSVFLFICPSVHLSVCLSGRETEAEKQRDRKSERWKGTEAERQRYAQTLFLHVQMGWVYEFALSVKIEYVLILYLICVQYIAVWVGLYVLLNNPLKLYVYALSSLFSIFFWKVSLLKRKRNFFGNNYSFLTFPVQSYKTFEHPLF